MSLISVFNFVVDIIFTLLYFRRRDNGKRKPGYLITSYVFLIMTSILYTSNMLPFLSGSIQRFLIRSALVFLFVHFSLCIRLTTAVYVTFYWCTMQTLIQSLFFAPLSYPVFTGAASFTGNYTADIIICMMITLLVKCLFYIPFLVLTPLMGMSPVFLIDIVPEILIAAVDIYVREIAILATPSQSNTGVSNNSEPNSYYLILQIALIIMLGFTEYNRKTRAQRMQEQIRNMETQALLNGINSNRENAQAISALRHDLKNHLLSLKLLNENGSTEEIKAYIDSLLEQGNPPRKVFHTGNDLADGLLSMKLDAENTKDIEVKVSMDLSSATFLTNEDLCVIMGNALDNAVEACSKVKGRKRFIYINGSLSANYLLLRFENSCAGIPTLINGLPEASKKDSLSHGYGLKNVSNILKKYDGNMNISKGGDGKFILNIMIPISSDQ